MEFTPPSLSNESRHAGATFYTATFTVAPTTPPELRQLAGELLADEYLAAQLDWMEDKSKDGALREAFLLELQCAAGSVRAWRIVDHGDGNTIGAVLVRSEAGGLDVEFLCESTEWNDAVSEEVIEPLVALLEGWHDVPAPADELDDL